MCGVAGIALADPTATPDRRALGRMTDAVRHRGPDDDGYLLAPGIGLGVRRLSIMDPEGGHQPISNEDGTVAVVCNGEIYNFVELRSQLTAGGHRLRTRSDSEVIVHLYEEHGPALVSQLRGMFGFALWDAGRRLLLLARDRLGIKPLHYRIEPDAIYFASEQKSILAGGRAEPRMDTAALRDVLMGGFVAGAKTLVAGIRRLEPGHTLVYRGGRTEIRKYWDVSFPEKRAYDGRHARRWVDGFRDKLEESVRLHMRSDVPVGFWLSGGIDSNAVAALAARLSKGPVEAYSLRFDHTAYDEFRGRARVDEFRGFPFRVHEARCDRRSFELLPKALWHNESPNASASEVPRLLTAQAAARDVKVVLAGEGADEILGGYGWFHVDKVLSPLPLGLRQLVLLGGLLPRRWPAVARAYLAPGPLDWPRYQLLINGTVPDLGLGVVSEELRSTLARVGPEETRPTLPVEFAGWHPFCQLQYFDLKFRLPDLVMHGLDRGSMACSLEVRVPFVDHELVEFAARIPPSVKMWLLREKYVLRRAMQGILAGPVVWRRKVPLMAPSDLWLREPLPEFAVDLLSESGLRKKGYFDPVAVTRLLGEHRSGEDRARLLMSVLSVQVWDEIFLRGWRP